MLNKFRPLIVTIGFLIAWIFTPLGRIPMAFIKLEAVKLPYTSFFFGLLLFGLYVLRERIGRASLLRSVLIGAVSGYLLSVISLLLADCLIPDGIHRLRNSFAVAGPLGALVIQFIFPGVLAGWLIVPLAVFTLKKSDSKHVGGNKN